MLSLVAMLLLGSPDVVVAPCTIRPPKGATVKQLAALAKLTETQAKAAVLKHVVGKATIQSGELEAENGCLVYSFDLKERGKSGVREVQLDAGTGAVVSDEYESDAKEREEQKAEAKQKP